jgi:hypothetical protein
MAGRMRRGWRAGLSTALALCTGLLANVFTRDWAWPAAAALAVFGIGWVALEMLWRPVEPASNGSAVLRQMPACALDLVGREAEFAALDRMTAGASVCVIVGTAGVGKTSLAVHWARRIAGRFPGGELYINLRGFDPAAAALTPAQAVNTALASLGLPAEGLPDGLDARAALFRTMAAQRRLLVLLDNASEAAQVRPLIPGLPGSLALVTSRYRLGSLVPRQATFALSMMRRRRGLSVLRFRQAM